MITNRVIKEIYRKFSNPSSKPEGTRLAYFIDKLAPMHHITMNADEVIFEDQDELSPFRRFLLRSLNGIIEFDSQVAFVFRNHILFLGKDSDEMRVHFRPVQESPNIIRRLFARAR
ncbi:MAG: hypothetical protein J5995_09800 [Muribaculaceae bacterium]|nr:hypothetical protein [Muribaculaceae bacterium]